MKLLLHHVLLYVSDMNRALRFYTEALGLSLLSKSEGFSVVGGEKFWISLHLSSKSAKDREGGEAGFLVLKPDNIHLAQEELIKNGVQFTRRIYEAAPGVLVTEFRDTEGNKLSLSTAD